MFKLLILQMEISNIKEEEYFNQEVIISMNMSTQTDWE